MATGATWSDWVTVAEKLGLSKVVIVNRSNNTLLAKNDNSDFASMFQFKNSWKNVIQGEMIVANWFRACFPNESKKEKDEKTFPMDVKNLCLQYRYAVNEIDELSKDWKTLGTIHLFGSRFFVVHRDERDGNWIVGRLDDECVFALKLTSIWFVVGGQIRGRSSDKDAKTLPIQKLFANFMINVTYPLQEAKV
eukprot:CAMPEP_0197030466 /NCGR_PEP_ID=MMETSP1384-20130603/9695_1 /TAXON_ID=29189 /ORGANISM="Ammonia sp." /LENGTH=192 /DNA_ID=CAMNT_0042459819 /DNA_START=17 /DNA_END=595 /DNA_ORIENTATION=+